VISGFSREVDEMCALLGYYAASSGNYLRTFLGFLPLEDGTDRLYQIVVWNYHYTLRNIPEKTQISSRYVFMTTLSKTNFYNVPLRSNKCLFPETSTSNKAKGVITKVKIQIGDCCCSLLRVIKMHFMICVSRILRILRVALKK
jgi:hypothetical protein